MAKLDDAKAILNAVEMPRAQCSDICCYTLLAMADITPGRSWHEASARFLRIHDIIQFSNSCYGTSYAENSRETFRKQALHGFRTAALVEDNGLATNSPNYRYRLTDEALSLLRSFGSSEWNDALAVFLNCHETLSALYASRRQIAKVPIRVNTSELMFSPGKHNELQRRFWRNSRRVLRRMPNVSM